VWKKPKSPFNPHSSLVRMEITIENVSIKLLDTLYHIEKQCFEQEAFTKQQLAYLLTDYKILRLAAFVNGKIAGFVISRVDIKRKVLFGHIITVDVTPAYRRQGVAQKLLQETEAIFKRRGFKECRLEVRENNVAALNLYRKLEYQEVCKLGKYYSKANGLYLKKTLINESAKNFTFESN
jgi:ribosomal protein S18 acetylase RimI-like enzyme